MDSFDDWQRQYRNRSIIFQSNKFEGLGLGDHITVSCYRNRKSESRQTLLNQKLDNKNELARLRKLVAEVEKECALKETRALRALVQVYVLARDLWEYEKNEIPFTDEFVYAKGTTKTGPKAGRGLFNLSDVLNFWKSLNIDYADLPVSKAPTILIPPKEITPQVAIQLIDAMDRFQSGDSPKKEVSDKAPQTLKESLVANDVISLQGGRVLLSKTFDRVSIDGDIVSLPSVPRKIIKMLYDAHQASPTFNGGVPVSEVNKAVPDSGTNLAGQRWQHYFRKGKLLKVREVLIDTTSQYRYLLLKV